MENSTKKFYEMFGSLLKELTDREQEVLKKRYQLYLEVPAKHTLKQIGDTYNITRERVRQIEREAINKISKQAKLEKYQNQLNEISQDLTAFLEKRGGVSTEKRLMENHLATTYDLGELHPNAFNFVADFLLGDLKHQTENDEHYSHWHLNDLPYQNVQKLIDEVYRHLSDKKVAVEEEVLMQDIKNEIFNQINDGYLQALMLKHSDLSLDQMILSYLEITKKIEKNILGLWGLADWADIRPKKLGDKINLVFQKEKQPLHFREVADRINQSGFDGKKICAATVHNELIANQGYVLIGRGIYAKQDWGYTSGTVTDIIVSILNQYNKPMTKEEIYQEVLKQRQVNPSTIYLSLINKNKFRKDNNGFFLV